MNTIKKRWSFLSALCLLLSFLLVASSCVAVGTTDPNATEGQQSQQTPDENDETPTQSGGNDNTPPADPNKVKFSISVKDAENYGWAGVRVQICEKGDSGKCSTPATTDENGNAVITIDKTMLDLNNSAVKIVKATGYVTTTAPIDIIPGETSKTVKLSEYVVKADSFGSAVENVSATVSLDGAAVATGKTGANGEVKFLLVTDDDYVLTVSSPAGATLVESGKTSWAFGEGFTVNLSYIVISLVDKTVTVVDESAQPVSGATVMLISSSNEKDEHGNYIAAYTGTTDATGKVIFTGLNSSSRYYVVVNNVAMAGEGGDKAWLDMGMTELTVTYSGTAAANKTYTVKVGYNDENNNFVVLEGAYDIVVVTYNDDGEEEGVARYTTVNGVVSFELPEKFYAVKIAETSIPEGYKGTGVVGFFDQIAELTLEEKAAAAPGESAENPLTWNTQNPMTGMPAETTQTLTGLQQGQQVWYQLTLSVGMELFVQTNTPGAIICISYNGRTVETNEGTATLVFDEASPMLPQALIGISLGGRIYSADVTLTVREAGSAGGGSTNNNPDQLSGSGTDNDPFILTEGGTYTAVVKSNNGWPTAVVYRITVAANGTLKVNGIGDNHDISLICFDKGIYPDPTNPAEGVHEISQTVSAGEVWTIVVSTQNGQAADIGFTVTVS